MRKKNNNAKKNNQSKNHALAAVGVSALIASTLYGAGNLECVYAEEIEPEQPAAVETEDQTKAQEDVKTPVDATAEKTQDTAGGGQGAGRRIV